MKDERTNTQKAFDLIADGIRPSKKLLAAAAEERKPRGGARPGAGRKSRYTTPTTRAVVHVPEAFIEALTERHGSLQAALEAYALQLDQSLSEYIKK